jgi:hypothetical protein
VTPLSIHRYDLLDKGVLHPGWTEDLERLVDEHAQATVLRGGTSTSLELPGTDLKYELVTGDVIARAAPWLFELYRGQLLRLAQQVYGHNLVSSDRVTSAVNVNVLTRIGARYEWHVDTNPITGLLFATTLGEEEGGALRFAGGSVDIRPTEGTFVLCTGRVPHTVTPLRVARRRISVVMNYYLTSEGESVRPADLDDYLYGPGR